MSEPGSFCAQPRRFLSEDTLLCRVESSSSSVSSTQRARSSKSSASISREAARLGLTCLVGCALRASRSWSWHQPPPPLFETPSEYATSASQGPHPPAKEPLMLKRLQKYRKQYEKDFSWVSQCHSSVVKAHCNICEEIYQSVMVVLVT